MLGAFWNSFHLFCIIVSIFEKEYQTVDWFACEVVSKNQEVAPGSLTEGHKVDLD